MTGSVTYEALLRQERRVMTHTVGCSMRPLLSDRESIVIVEAADRVPPRRGDVVLYKTGETYILHRVLRIKPEEYLTRGDNTWVIEHVPKDAVLATMTGFYRYPESRLVSRNNIAYRLYVLALPEIRLVRRGGSKVKREIRKAMRMKPL